jgi:hypothetical protein
MTSMHAWRAAAMLLWINGIGFGVPCIRAMRELAAGRGIPFLMGFPAYGHGPFQRHGIISSVPLVAGFLLVCLAECVAGWMLWNGSRAGAVLALILLPFGAIYWWDLRCRFHRPSRLWVRCSL